MNLDSSGNSVLAGAGPEVFALTDEQILEMGPEEEALASAEEAVGASQGPSTAAATAAAFARDDRKRTDGVSPRDGKGVQRPRESSSGQAGMTVPEEPPGWLAREMRDPWVGEEARELWEGTQRAEREAAEYREAFGSAEDARALKEIYPGGVAEARSAAERARELTEIDAVFFGAPGRPAEELRAGRAQLVERLYAQDAAAFREMVEAGIRLLERATSGQRPATSEEGRSDPNVATVPGSLRSEPQTARLSGRDDRLGSNANRNLQHVQAYRELERVANAELESSVGKAIGRAMEAALPNLRWAEKADVRQSGPFDAQGKQAPSLQERLGTSVREEVEAGLKSDAGLGEQVARVLSGRRFDEATRAQVVRLIDARAQQLVPGAVRRVVGSWTAATLGGAKMEPGGEERKTVASTRTRNAGQNVARDERAMTQESGRKSARGRVDYRRWSDEQILEM